MFLILESGLIGSILESGSIGRLFPPNEELAWRLMFVLGVIFSWVYAVGHGIAQVNDIITELARRAF